jgi:hypothetical protein
MTMTRRVVSAIGCAFFLQAAASAQLPQGAAQAPAAMAPTAARASSVRPPLPEGVIEIFPPVEMNRMVPNAPGPIAATPPSPGPVAVPSVPLTNPAPIPSSPRNEPQRAVSSSAPTAIVTVSDTEQRQPVAPIQSSPPAPTRSFSTASGGTVAPVQTTSPVAKAPAERVLDESAVAGNCPAPRIWFTGESLFWWMRHGSLPLLTTGDPVNDRLPGALGQPGTRIIGGGDTDLGTFVGARFTLGGWLNDCFGVEANGFFLTQRQNTVSAASDASGHPYLSFPFFRADVGREGAFTIADPTFPQTGAVQMTLQTQLWGTELNALFAGARSGNWSVNWRAGFRYLELKENALINESFNFENRIFGFLAGTSDQFEARNQFYGGQLGIDLNYQSNRLTLGLQAMLALGVNHETLGISGQAFAVATGPFATGGTTNYGFFSEPSNLGTFHEDHFNVIPQLRLTAAYEVCSHMRVLLGYDFLYWGSVIRAGDQIDRRINPTQSLFLSNGTLVGPAVPTADFHRSDFWAQGISLGVEFRY